MSLPKDKCPYCGAEREFGLYAAAHWDLLLDTTCENPECKKPYSVRRGFAIKQGVRKRKG